MTPAGTASFPSFPMSISSCFSSRAMRELTNTGLIRDLARAEPQPPRLPASPASPATLPRPSPTPGSEPGANPHRRCIRFPSSVPRAVPRTRTSSTQAALVVSSVERLRGNAAEPRGGDQGEARRLRGSVDQGAGPTKGKREAFQVSGLSSREPGSGVQVRVQAQDLNIARARTCT
jgi:hypothetical protein